MKTTNIATLPGIDDTYAMVCRLNYLREEIKKLQCEEDLIKTQLNNGYFKSSDQFIYHGRVVAMLEIAKRSGLNTAELKTQLPDVYQQFKTETVYTKIKIYL